MDVEFRRLLYVCDKPDANPICDVNLRIGGTRRGRDGLGLDILIILFEDVTHKLLNRVSDMAFSLIFLDEFFNDFGE